MGMTPAEKQRAYRERKAMDNGRSTPPVASNGPGRSRAAKVDDSPLGRAVAVAAKRARWPVSTGLRHDLTEPKATARYGFVIREDVSFLRRCRSCGRLAPIEEYPGRGWDCSEHF